MDPHLLGFAPGCSMVARAIGDRDIGDILIARPHIHQVGAGGMPERSLQPGSLPQAATALPPCLKHVYGPGRDF